MTTELEKQFFQCFELEIPMVKTVEYSNDPFAHCDDWWYGERTFKEAGIEEYTVNRLNQAIKEFKEKHPKEVKHNGVLTQKYRIVEAFIKYPQITDRILLELIRIIGLITIKYTNEQCEICYSDGPISYLGKDLKEAILNFLISKVSIFKHQVQAIFERER